MMALDGLASWNDSAAKNSILDFVQRATTEGGRDPLLITCAISIIDPAEEASRGQTVGSSTQTRQGFQSAGSRSLPLR